MDLLLGSLSVCLSHTFYLHISLSHSLIFSYSLSLSLLFSPFSLFLISTGLSFFVYHSDILIMYEQVEDHRNEQPTLGKVKNLHLGNENRDPNTVFGRPSFLPRSGGRGRVSAEEIMRGEHNKEHSKNWIEADRDLGTAIMPGFRNITWVGQRFIFL